MSRSDAWDDLGPHSVDPKVSAEIKRQLGLEGSVSDEVRAQALKILDLRDSAVQNPRDREYDSRAEKIMTLRLIKGTGYPIIEHYAQMSDHQLENYIIRVNQLIRVGYVSFFS